MVGELEVIFGLDAVPRKLRITRHALVFLEQLRRIAALALVAGVAAPAVAAHSLGTLSTTAATAAVLTIVDQECWSSSHGAMTRPILSFGKKSGPRSRTACIGTTAADVPQALALGRPMSSGVGRRELEVRLSGPVPAAI
jgi:hypothetical protein